ncbi:MAG: ABC transporter ATP-binding protein [Chloroflexota bacterium]
MNARVSATSGMAGSPPRLAPDGAGGGGAASARPPVVEMRRIRKQFGPVVANDDVNLTLREGEVHALLGENGAGKTTLMSILSGMYQPDAGEILLDGQQVRIGSPAEALSHGIGAVYQHFTLVPNMSVIENVTLGAGRNVVLDLDAAERDLQARLGEFGLNVSPRSKVSDLSIGQRQRVEIVKVLSRGTRVLLLDEPTSVLTPVEVEGLLDLIRQLKARGVAVVIVTHKLDEALAVSDRVTVLRGGRKVAELGPDQIAAGARADAKRRVVEAMFGGGAGAGEAAAPEGGTADAGPVLLALREVRADGAHGAEAVRGITLELRAGEIFGIAGVDGTGQKELGEVIAGQRHVRSGSVTLDGTEITNGGVAKASALGVGYVTDERLHEGCVTSATVADNAVLKAVGRAPFSNGWWLNRAAIDAHARALIQQFDVRTPGPDVRIGLLSGGNIQKLLMARELAGNPRVLVCNKPTHGLDLRTARFVAETLRRHADAGNAVLLISSELDEIFDISDRIGVMYNGDLAAVFPRGAADAETIGQIMLAGRAGAASAAGTEARA